MAAKEAVPTALSWTQGQKKHLISRVNGVFLMYPSWQGGTREEAEADRSPGWGWRRVASFPQLGSGWVWS